MGLVLTPSYYICLEDSLNDDLGCSDEPRPKLPKTKKKKKEQKRKKTKKQKPKKKNLVDISEVQHNFLKIAEQRLLITIFELLTHLIQQLINARDMICPPKTLLMLQQVKDSGKT